jgi:hypothetical protein
MEEEKKNDEHVIEIALTKKNIIVASAVIIALVILGCIYIPQGTITGYMDNSGFNFTEEYYNSSYSMDDYKTFENNMKLVSDDACELEAPIYNCYVWDNSESKEYTNLEFNPALRMLAASKNSENISIDCSITDFICIGEVSYGK